MPDVIKEFLVGLGFKADEDQLRKFNDHIKRATVAVTSLGKSIGVTVTGIAAGVDEMSSRFEDFYYIAQRTHSSVANLQAMQYGFRQIGLSANQAMASAENFASTLRTNPGMQSLVTMLTGKSPNGRDSTQVYNDVIGRLKQMPFFVAAQYGQQLGTDPDTLFQILQNFDRLKAAEADRDTRLKEAGIHTDELAGKSVEFQNVLKRLDDDLGIFGTKMTENFIGPAIKAAEAIDAIVQAANRLGNATGGLSTSIIAAGSAFGAWKLGRGLLTRLLPGIFGGGAAAGGAAAAEGAGAAATAGGGVLSGILGAVAAPAAGLATMFYSPGTNKGEDEYMAAHPEKYRQAGNAEKLIQAFMAKGWSRAQASGMVARLQMESNLNPGAVNPNDRGMAAYGLAQWRDPMRIGNFKSRYGHNIWDSTMQEQVDFIDWELRSNKGFGGAALQQALDPGTAYSVFTAGFERPKNTNDAVGALNATRLFSGTSLGGVSMSQTTNIYVQGTEAHTTAQAVTDAQSRVNGDMLRDMQGAIQ